MIKIENVSKQLEKFKLKDIDITIPKGYISGLIGENGAGKTSLLRMILGLYVPDTGRVIVDGHDVQKEEVLVKNMIGYVLSEELFDGALTLLENGRYYGKYYEEYNEEILLEYCERFNLNPHSKLKMNSKGEKLKFQFAFALAHNPRVLILDEPTAGFDPEFRTEFLKILTEFIKDGERSVLLATHLTSDLERFGDYITFMHKGEVLFSSSREELLDGYKIIKGEDYKIKLLPEDIIIYKEKAGQITKALVKHRRFATYDKEVTVESPTIEDLMYAIIKGDKYV